jgi:hypothetical protein
MKNILLKTKIYVSILLFLAFINFYFILYLNYSIGADINDYLYNLNSYAVQQRKIIVPGKGYFYELISFLNLFLKFDAKNLFILLFNTISFVVSLILFKNTTNSKNFLAVYFLIWMVLITPSILEFLISNIRSSFAFALFLIGLNLKSKLLKLIFFLFSSLFHLLIIPIIITFFLFYYIKKTHPFNKLDFNLNFMIIFIFNSIIIYFTSIIKFIEPSSKGYFYLIFMLSFTAIFFIFKRCIKFIEGYLAFSLILLVNIALIIGLDFSRYFPISVILFSIFLIKNDTQKSIIIFNFFYFIVLCIEYLTFYRSLAFLSLIKL